MKQQLQGSSNISSNNNTDRKDDNDKDSSSTKSKKKMMQKKKSKNISKKSSSKQVNNKTKTKSRTTTMPSIKLLHLQPTLHERAVLENWVENVAQDVEIIKLQNWIQRIDSKLKAASKAAKANAKEDVQKSKRKGAAKEHAEVRPLLKECQQLVTQYASPVDAYAWSSSSLSPKQKKKAAQSKTRSTTDMTTSNFLRQFWDMLVVCPNDDDEGKNNNKDRIPSNSKELNAAAQDRIRRDAKILMKLQQYSNDEPIIWSKANQHKKKLRHAAEKEEKAKNNKTKKSKTPSAQPEKVPWESIIGIHETQQDGNADTNQRQFAAVKATSKRLFQRLPPRHYDSLMKELEQLYGDLSPLSLSPSPSPPPSSEEEDRPSTPEALEVARSTAIRSSFLAQLGKAITQDQYVHIAALELANSIVRLKIPSSSADKTDKSSGNMNDAANDKEGGEVVGIEQLDFSQQRDLQLELVAREPRIIDSYKEWQSTKDAIVDSFLSIQKILLEEDKELKVDKDAVNKTGNDEVYIDFDSSDLHDDEPFTLDDNDEQEEYEDGSEQGEAGDSTLDYLTDAISTWSKEEAEDQAEILLRKERSTTIEKEEKKAKSMDTYPTALEMANCLFEAIYMDEHHASSETLVVDKNSASSSLPTYLNSLDHSLSTKVGPLPVETPPADRVAIVDNLPIDVDPDYLLEVFSRCGPIEALQIFQKRPELDPGRKRSDSKKKIRPPNMKGYRVWKRSRTPLYAVIVFKDEIGCQMATSDPLRVFGMVIDNHLMRTHRARDMTKLYLENVPLTEYSIKDMEFHLSQVLHPELYVHLEEIYSGKNYYRKRKRIETIRQPRLFTMTCQINFPTFEATYSAYSKLSRNLEVLQPGTALDQLTNDQEVATQKDNSSTVGTDDITASYTKPCLHWIATSHDAMMYWTRQLNY